MPLEYIVSKHPSMYLTPKQDGSVNVIDNFSWTLSPKSSRKNVPYVDLIEYQQNAGQLISSILYFLRIYNTTESITDLLEAPKDPGDLYKLKYIAEPTGFRYRFPYFSAKKTSRTSDFGYEDGQSPFSAAHKLGQSAVAYGERIGSGSSIRRLFAEVAEIGALGQAGVGLLNTMVPGKFQLEHPQSWVGTTEGEYTFTFDLFNTGTTDDVIQNRNLCYILTYQNSPARRNFALTDPVCIYSVHIPDVVDMPAAYINGLEITNLGNTRVVKSDGFNNGSGFIIPEAYRISITLRSLFMPTRNIMAGLDNGNKVEAISNVDIDLIKSILKGSFTGDFSEVTPEKLTNLANQLNITPQHLQNIIDGIKKESITSTPIQ